MITRACEFTGPVFRAVLTGELPLAAEPATVA